MSEAARRRGAAWKWNVESTPAWPSPGLEELSGCSCFRVWRDRLAGGSEGTWD